MALETKAGKFALNSGTGSQSVTGVGFEPKVIIFFTTGNDSAVWIHSILDFGVSTAAASRCIRWAAVEVNPPTGVVSQNDNKALQGYSTAGAQTFPGFTLTSMDSDGFTISRSHGSSGYDIGYFALGGADLTNAHVATYSVPAVTGSQAYSGVGFEPDAIMLFGVTNGTINSAQIVDPMSAFIGFGTAASQCVSGWGFDELANPSDMARTFRTDRIVSTLDLPGVSGVRNQASLTSLDTDGFTLNWDVRNTSDIFFGLCLKGPNIKLGTDTVNTTTGTKATTGVGFQPKGVLTLSALANFGSSLSSNYDQSFSALSHGSGTPEGFAITLMGEDGLSTNQIGNGGLDDQLLMHYLRNGTAVLRATISSFDSDGFTANYTPVPGSAYDFAYLALGDSEAASEHNETASSTLELDHALDHGETFELEASSVLGTSDLATSSTILEREASSVLTLSDDASGSTALFVSASTAMSLAQLAEAAEAIEDDASSALGLNQTAVFARNIERTASNVMALDNTVRENAIRVSASNTLALVQAASHNLKLVPASSALILEQDVEIASSILESLSSVAALTQELTHNLKFGVASSAMSLVPILTYNLNGATSIPASSTLEMTDEVELGNFIYRRTLPVDQSEARIALLQTIQLGGIRSAALSSLMQINHTISARVAIRNLSIGHILSFAMRLGRVHTGSPSSALEFAQELYRISTALNTLGLTSVAEVIATKIVNSNFEFSHVLSILKNLARPVETEMLLLQHVSAELGENLCQYSMLSGTAPTLTRDILTLRYPASAPTLTVELRNPQFGNRDTLAFSRIKSESRGGTLLIYSDSHWPKTQTLSLDIETLTTDQRNSLRTFLESSLGREILLDDWEGRTWRGLILNPDTEITQTGINQHAVSLQFVGELT